MPHYLLARLELLLVEWNSGAGDVKSIGIFGQFLEPKVCSRLLRLLTHHEVYDNLASILAKSLILCRLLPLGDILVHLLFSQYLIPLHLFLTFLLIESLLVKVVVRIRIRRVSIEAASVIFRSD